MSEPQPERWVQLSLEDYAREVPQQLLSADEMFDGLDERNLRKWKENSKFEKKSALVSPQDIGDYCSMWANTPPGGGIIVLGISKDDKFEGCLSIGIDKQNEREHAPMQFCPDAQVRCKQIPIKRDEDGADDFVLAFRVRYHPSKVVKTARATVHQRFGESIRTLTAEQTKDLMGEKGEVSFEKESCQLKFPQDFRTDDIARFANSVRTIKTWTGPHSDIEILKLLKLGEIVDGQFVPSINCALLFANDPKDVTPGCRVRFLRFAGTLERSGTDWNTDKDEWIDGTIPELISKTEKLLQSQLRLFSRLEPSGRFETSPEYPHDAWYEAVINALAHRSYGNGLRTAHVVVKMFDDRLEIESPGAFMPTVSPANIYDSQVSRNPFLMDALYHMEYVRAANEGTRRMRALMENMGLPAPEFIQEQIGNTKVKVTLKNQVNQRRRWVDSDIAELIGSKIASTLSEDELRIMNYIAVNESMNVTQAVRNVGRNWGTSKKLLEGLVRKRLLFRVHKFGGARGAVDRQSYYRLAKADDVFER